MRKLRFYLDQSGGVAVMFGVALTVLVGIGAVVIDLGHLYVVKREMQNACDVGACAGVNALYPKTNLTGQPQWSSVNTAVVNAMKRCAVDGALLTDFTSVNVEMGCWNKTWTNSTAPAHLNGYLDAATYYPTTSNSPRIEYPAVKVTLSKTNAGTGTSGPVKAYLASALGFNTLEVKGVSAVAARFFPGHLPAGAFPFAIPQSVFKPDGPFSVKSIIQDNGNGQKKLDANGNPIYDYVQGGQWTSFFDDSNNADSNIVNLISTGCTTDLTAGDKIYILEGCMSNIYADVGKGCIYDPATNSPIYMVPVVDDSTGPLNPGTFATVNGFVAIKILDAKGAGSNNSYVNCQFVPDYVDPDASGAGNDYNDPLPVKLVN